MTNEKMVEMMEERIWKAVEALDAISTGTDGRKHMLHNDESQHEEVYGKAVEILKENGFGLGDSATDGALHDSYFTSYIDKVTDEEDLVVEGVICLTSHHYDASETPDDVDYRFTNLYVSYAYIEDSNQKRTDLL